MLNAQDLGNCLREYGFDFYSGVPCSFLKDLINYAINDCTYVGAANEGDAVAIAAGAALGGKRSVVLMQNSGLTNATSPLTSLTYTFKLPVLGFVSLRGEEGIKDEPQHELMGKITIEMLELMKIPHAILADNAEELKVQMKQVDEHMKRGETFFFVVKKGTIGEVKLNPHDKKPRRKEALTLTYSQGDFDPPTRTEALKVIAKAADQHVCVMATTGKTGRELFDVEDRPNNLYMVGSMGCVSSLGLGLSLNSDKKVIAVDGDGALIMRAGNLATNAYYAPKNLLHVLLDNEAHDSTGGQFTVSSHVDFPLIAHGFSYPRVIECANVTELEAAIENWKKDSTLTFIYLKIKPGSPKALPRPDVKPPEVKERFMRFIND